ncbi:MAG: hypothetical protein RKH07_12700 [Gammaproteobacteria bacterium]
MKCKALKNFPKVIDGKPVGPFRKGQDVDLPKDLAEKFIDSAMFEEVKPPAPAPAKKDAEKNSKPAAATTEKKPTTGKAKSD